MTLDGFLCTALVDGSSGMCMGTAGSGIDMELAAASNTDVVRAKLKAINLLNLNDNIDDILITLGRQYHIIRPFGTSETFFYLVLDKNRANLALARRKVAEIEKGLEL